MSPILKRDIAEQVRQARRLSQVLTGSTSPPTPSEERDMQVGSSTSAAYTSGSSLRKGIGVDEGWTSGLGKGKDVGHGRERSSTEDDVDGTPASAVVVERSRGRIRIEELEYEEQDTDLGKNHGSAKLKDLRNLLFEVCRLLCYP
jgi:hypothetical protein